MLLFLGEGKGKVHGCACLGEEHCCWRGNETLAGGLWGAWGLVSLLKYTPWYGLHVWPESALPMKKK